MRKTILITGSTDGIGFETAKLLVSAGHHVLLHGRSAAKLHAAGEVLSAASAGGSVQTCLGDFSNMMEVEAVATQVTSNLTKLDVLINNAGVFKTPHRTTTNGLDVRFAVNTIAPYLLTRRLLPFLGDTGRVVNVSSAAQAPVSLNALAGRTKLNDMDAYAQSKLALNMWSNHLAKSIQTSVFSVNPGSMLGSKMVKEGFGVDGADLSIGADILKRAALSEQFADASGQYFDNDSKTFSQPHRDALDPAKTERVVHAIEKILQKTVSMKASDKGTSGPGPSH